MEVVKRLVFPSGGQTVCHGKFAGALTVRDAQDPAAEGAGFLDEVNVCSSGFHYCGAMTLTADVRHHESQMGKGLFYLLR